MSEEAKIELDRLHQDVERLRDGVLALLSTFSKGIQLEFGARTGAISEGSELLIEYLNIILKASPRLVVIKNRPFIEYSFIGQPDGKENEQYTVGKFYLFQVKEGGYFGKDWAETGRKFVLSREPRADIDARICNLNDVQEIIDKIVVPTCQALLASPMMQPR